MLAGFRVSITDTTQWDGTFLCRLSAGELDGLIAGQAFACQDRSATDNSGFGIGLKSSNKEYPFFCQLLVPGVVIIATVDSHHTAFGELQGTTHLNITGLAVSDSDELG